MFQINRLLLRMENQEKKMILLLILGTGYMDDSQRGFYWPLHFPMAKAIVKAMDVSEGILESKKLPIKGFVLSGLSKRGWAVWLATIGDNKNRITAIVSGVIDIFNVKENIDHIFNSYGEWPIAFYDYVSQNVTERINSKEFNQLVMLEDPIKYLAYDKFKKRLSIPKIIISASGDDFFVVIFLCCNFCNYSAATK